MKKTLQFLGFKKTKTRKKFDYYFIKGFTLVEIIGAIVLLTVIGLIIYPVINNLISDSKDDLYKKQIEELERISNTWVTRNYKKLKLEAGYSYNLSFEELKEAGLISEQHIKNPKTGELLEGCITLSYNSENKNYDIKYDSECQAYGETKHPTIVLSTNSGVINGYGYATSNFDVVVSGSNITSYMYCKGEYECEPDTKVESSSGIIPISNNGTTYVCAIGTNEFMSSEKVCKVYKLDKTKPEEGELVIDGTLGENGWYVSDVKLSVRDVEGVTSTLNITEITRDTSGTEIIMTSKNNKTGAVKVTNYTVKVDKTKPTVGELVINGTKGNNGWYKSDVVFSVVNGNDTLSGHADTISSIASITKDTKGTKVIVTTKDKAGNTSTKEYTVKVDKTAPTAGTLTINGEKGSGDWYLSDVTFTINDGSDATSGHAKTTSTHTSVIGETTGTKVVVTTIDNAGNTSTREYNIKIDKNKPTEGTLVIDGTLGENGWYVSDVKLSVKDIEGVTSTLNITEITSDTSGQEVVMTTKNNKTGAVKVTKYTIKVDKTKPTVGELAINGTKGNNGWYTSDVTFSVKNGSDSTSGHATTTSSITSIIKDTKGTKVIVTTKDKAGNTSTKEYIVKVDKTAPTAGTLTISGTKGSGDWYLSDVTLTVNNGSDSTSGHAKTTSTHTSVSGNTSGTKVVVTTVDNAGNTSTREYNIKIDKNKPTEGTLVIDGTLGENGWYVSNVNLSVKDIEGVTSTLNINKITSNTAGTEVVMTSKNNKTGAVKVTKYTVKVDKTKPTVGELVINGTKGNNGWYTSDVTFSVKNGSDSMSGHSKTTSSITSITKDTTGTKVVVTTKDKAGNTATKEYTVKVDKTAPIPGTLTISGTKGLGDWYLSDVTLKVNDGSDVTSGHAKTTSTHTSVSGNTSGTKVVVTTVDNAGNTSTREYNIKIDKEEPEEGTLIIDGNLGENGWYVSDVKLSVSDTAGITSTLNITEITSDTKGTEVVMTSTNDTTGAVKVTKYTVKVDKTKPTVGELVISGTKGDNGWYKSNVTFSVKNGSDSTSGHASTTSSITSITKDTKGTKVVVTTKDKAGNTSTKEYIVKMDKTAPIPGTLTISGTKGLGEWYLSDVTLKVNDGSDSTSGHASTTSTHTSVVGNTSGTVVTVTTKDKAGNTATRKYTIRIDKNEPTAGTLIIDGNLGENGWYVSDVKLSVSDTAGITSTLNITKITSDTKGTEVTMTSKNNTTGAVKVTKYTVKVDKTKPTIGKLVINGTEGNNGWYKSNVTFSVTNGSDTLSGHASTTSSISSITKDTKGTKVILTTKDKAGNITTKEYTIKMDKTAPTTPTSMNFVFGNWSQYTDNTWTNQSIYAASTTSNPGPSGSSDTTSGLWKYQISTDNVNWVDYNYTASGIYLMSTDGVHTRYFRAVDNAGNVSSIISRTAKVDKTAPTVPTVTYNSGSNSCSWKNNYNLTLNSSDSLSGVRVYQVDWTGDSASNSDVASNFIPWNGYSSCNNRFRAVDNAGNVSEWTGVHHIHMDTEKPAHTNWWWGTVNKDIAQLYIQTTDNVGISRVQCPTSTATGGYNNWHWFNAVWDSSQNAYRCDITPSTFGHYNQTYTTHLYIYDHAGNGGYYNATNANIPVNERFLRSEILSESIKGSNVTWTTAWQTGNTSGLYSQSTSKGTTYYFRGNPTNNYIKFANKIWRIIRVNEDGTVKIMLNDAVSGDIFNSSTYGFDKMYYSNSNLKNIVNSWYNTNITGTNASKVVTGSYFCEAAKLMYFSGSVGNFSVPVKENYTPNFECATDGNGKGLVTASVGLITYDEIAFAGGWYYDFSLSYPYYLNNANLADRARWTMSPAGNNSDSSYALAFIIYNGGAWHTAVSSGSLISPVVNLKGDIAITGSGTSSDPYVPKN